MMDSDTLDDLPTLEENPSLVEGGHFAAIEIFEDVEKGATLRTRNEPADQEQRPVVAVRGRKSLTYKGAVELATCVHGFLDESATPKVPATLIILNYRVNGLRKGHANFASIYTSMEFENQVKQDPQLEPYVKALAPFDVPQADMETEREVLIKDTYRVTGLSVNVAGVEGGLEGDAGRETEETRRTAYFQLLQGSVSSAKAGMKGYDTAWWNLRQNDHTQQGVPPVFSTAMLLLRADATSPFKGKFVLATEVNWVDKITNRMSHYFGISKDDPILFNPTLPPVGLPSGVKPSKLGELILGSLAGHQNIQHQGQ